MIRTEGLKFEILTEEINAYDLIFNSIGDTGVGKSCLAIRGTKNSFEECSFSNCWFLILSFYIKINDNI